MRAVAEASLPIRGRLALIGERYMPLLAGPLEKLGVEALPVPDNMAVDLRLWGHADLSVLHLGGERLWLAPYLKGSALAERLSGLGFRLAWAGIDQGPVYPKDAGLNLCVFGRWAIYAPKLCPTEILEELEPMEKIPVRQGYCNCSVLPVDGDTIITADKGIAQAAGERGVSVLRISPGHIALPGFDYGFIGGSGAMISRDRLAFTGTLEGHPDRDRILELLSLRGIEPVYLTDQPIFDVGSIIVIGEYT